MRWMPGILCSLLLAAPSHSSADVVDSTDSGFSLVYQSTIPGSPKSVYDHFVNAGSWWNPSHTWSGDSRNLSIDVAPGGGLLEKLPSGGFVRHLDIVYADPGSLLRFRGALGPLQELALQGTMTVRFKPAGDQTELQVNYNVSGYAKGGLKAWAAPVNQVLTEQFDRLKKRVEGTLP